MARSLEFYVYSLVDPRDGKPFYIGKGQYETWKHTQLIIDVIDGHGGTFSLEGPEGKAFHTRSRVFTEDELAALERLPMSAAMSAAAITPNRPVGSRLLPRGVFVWALYGRQPSLQAMPACASPLPQATAAAKLKRCWIPLLI